MQVYICPQIKKYKSNYTALVLLTIHHSKFFILHYFIIMSISIIFTTTLLVVCCMLLVPLILLQNPKDDGPSVYGGKSIQNLVGIGQAASLVEKATYTLALMIFILALLTSYLIKQQYGKPKQSALVEHLEQYEGDLVGN